ncbi:MAG: F0F1 ATP synthase subunit B [Phycisphaeraceae bacterium JB051]
MSMQPSVLNLVLAAGGDNPFAGTIYQGIAAAIVFIVVLVILKKLAWGPILTGLQDRENKIKTDLEEAEKSAKDATATLKQYEAKLAAAQEESRKLIEEARGEAQRVAAQLKDQTQTEITQMKDKAARDINAAKEQALTELYAQAAVMSTQIAGRILKRELNADDQQAIVDESLAQLKAENN